MEITSPTAPPPTAFSLFPYLPTELRLHIWRLSLSPRVVTLTYRPAPLEQCFSPTPPPAILSACQESRDEALRFYRRTFGTKAHPEGRIYFHPALDVLYVPRTGMMGYSDAARDFGTVVLSSGADLIRKVAVDYVNPEIRRPWEVYSKFCLIRGFPNLKEAYLVIASSDSQPPQQGGAAGDVELIDPRGNKEEIMGIMERVRESFRHEVPMEEFVEGKVVEEPGEGEDEWGRFEIDTGLELVPKAKIRGGQHRGVGMSMGMGIGGAMGSVIYAS
ncbi:hypothetical protein QBC35DRAFT_222007 [Podospora australis]|uniref:2EXR domain-containing protein n=1 Tax=Podospora australis TaxID=1536484 RepID=A0AAN6X6U4_9PEZI|nr:hypothetical protein QBC35DRAFT_222007 [Podospora australis]